MHVNVTDKTIEELHAEIIDAVLSLIHKHKKNQELSHQEARLKANGDITVTKINTL